MEGRSKGFMNLFWDLANSNEDKRITGAEKLYDTLKQLQLKDATELHSDVKYTIERLVAGLASSRDSARLGFATALTSILRHLPSTVFTANDLINLMNEKLKLSGKTKNEDKDIMFGRVFCLLSLIESKKLFDFNDNEESLTKTFQELLKLSKKKSYLSQICFHGVGQIIQQVTAPLFERDIWPLLAPFFIGGWENCTPELLQLLIVCCCHQSQICNKEFLKSYKWISDKAKKPELITQHNFKHLARIIAETTSCHPMVNPITRNILSTIAQHGKKKLGAFWSEFLTPTLLSSTPERKYLGFKLAVYSLTLIDSEQIPLIFSSDLLINLYHALLNKKNPLNLFCKNNLPKDFAEKLALPEVGPDVQYALLFQLFSSPGGIHLDSMTHTAILSSVVSNFKYPALMKYIKWLKKLFLNGTDANTGIKEIDLIMARRWSASQLSNLTRMSSLPRNEKWITEITKFLFFHSHFKVTNTTNSQDIEELKVGDHFMELSEQSYKHVAQNFVTVMSILNKILPLPADETTSFEKTGSKIAGLMSDGSFWMSMIIKYSDKLLKTEGCECITELTDEVKKIWAKSMENIKKMEKFKNAKTNQSSEATALQLLLLHISIQLLSSDPEVQSVSQDVLKDLGVIIEERFSSKKKKKKKEDQPHWVEVIIEILLSMLSQGSNSVRVIAEQVFKLVGPHLTTAGLKLVTDVLLIKNNDLLKEEEEQEEMEEDGEEEEKEEDNDPEDSDSDADSTSSHSSSEEDTDNEDTKVDEEFRRRIKEALGDAGPSDEEDKKSDEEEEEDEDFSDDAMMRIDPLLADIFKQRKKSKKATEKHTKLQVTHFQLRCLDLLDIFITRHHATNPLVLDLVPPLLECVELASKDPSKGLLADKASVVLRVKLCKMKGYPHDLSEDEITRCHDNIEAILKKCHTTSGVFMSQLSSNCCLFYLRVLSGNSNEKKGPSGAVDTDRICSLYDSALKDYMLTRESRLQFCVIQEFVSRYPAIAKSLAPSLINYVKNGVQIYRKTQAIQLLSNLLNSCRDSGDKIAESVITLTQDVAKTINSQSSTEVKPKYLAELLRLCFQSYQHKKLKPDFDWSGLTHYLQELLQTEVVSRSQELVNLTWKILTPLGINRVKAVKPVKKPKKEKKIKETDQNNNKENEDSENTESRKERVKRIRKEKKKAQKESKAKGKKNKRQRERKMEAENETENVETVKKSKGKKRKMEAEKNEDKSTVEN